VADAVKERDTRVQHIDKLAEGYRPAQYAEENARLRAALQHEVYRNHEHTPACTMCEQSDEALRAGEGK
jgi:hypothetical protein